MYQASEAKIIAQLKTVSLYSSRPDSENSRDKGKKSKYGYDGDMHGFMRVTRGAGGAVCHGDCVNV